MQICGHNTHRACSCLQTSVITLRKWPSMGCQRIRHKPLPWGKLKHRNSKNLNILQTVRHSWVHGNSELQRNKGEWFANNAARFHSPSMASSFSSFRRRWGGRPTDRVLSQTTGIYCTAEQMREGLSRKLKEMF